MHQVNTAIAIAGFVVVLAGLASARLESLPFSKPLIALGIGIAAARRCFTGSGRTIGRMRTRS